MSSPEPTSLTLGSEALEIVFGKTEDGAIGGAVRNERQARVKYWRKPDYDGATDAGWIMPGPDVGTDAPKYKQYTDKGRKELPDRFGKQITGQPDTTIKWEANRAQQRNPLVWLEPFIKAGGLTYVIQPNDGFGPSGHFLMPAEQIICYGLHRRPGIKEIRPDLKSAVDLQCPLGCINEASRTRQLFAGVNEEEAQKSLDQHMVAKHRESEGARAMGREFQQVLAPTSGGMSDADIAKIAAIVAATIQGMQAPKPEVLEAIKSLPQVADEALQDAIKNVRADLKAFDLSSATRQEMMAYTKAQGIAYPSNGAAMNTEAWREYLAPRLAA